jgi:rod shape determining protein RodA
MLRIREIRLGDPTLMGVVVALSIFGVAMVYSAGLVDTPFTLVAGLWRMQLLWFAVGIMMIPVLLSIPSHWFKLAAPFFYVVAVVMLALTLVIGIGVGTAEGVPRWLGVGPVRVQTAEVAKIAVILMLARTLGDRIAPPKHLTDLIKPIMLVLVPIGLVLLQPDLGTAIVFSVILLASLFWAGTPAALIIFLISPAVALLLAVNTWIWGLWILVLAGLLYYFKLRLGEAFAVMGANVAAGTVAAPVWNMLEPYQQNRILVFLDPSIDPRGAGYNLIQSRVAIGSGGLYGKGFGEGSQKRLAFLPEQHTDFIFSVIGEEWGFIGVAVILVAFGVVFWRLVRIASLAADPFASIVPFALF